MIGKINQTISFNNTISYVLSKDKTPELLENNLVSEPNHLNKQEIISLFESTVTKWKNAGKVNRLTKPCCHISLSFAPTDRVSNRTIGEIGVEIVKRMGFIDNQYIVVKHDPENLGGLTTNHKHPHCHIVINRVQNNNGIVTNKDFNYYKICNVLRKLELEYDLTPVNNPREMAFKNCDRQYKKYLDSGKTSNIIKFHIQNHIYSNLLLARKKKKPNFKKFLDNLQSPDWLEVKFWNKSGENISREEVNSLINNGEAHNVGISYGAWDEKNQKMVTIPGHKIGKLGKVYGMQKFVEGDENYLNLKVPTTLQFYTDENFYNSQIHTDKIEALPPIPLQFAYFQYLNHMNKQVLELDDDEEEIDDEVFYQSLRIGHSSAPGCLPLIFNQFSR